MAEDRIAQLRSEGNAAFGRWELDLALDRFQEFLVLAKQKGLSFRFNHTAGGLVGFDQLANVLASLVDEAEIVLK